MSGDGNAHSPTPTPASERVAEAADERRRRRLAHEEDRSATSMRDVLVGVAERGQRVAVGTRRGGSHRVRIVGVGVDGILATLSQGGRLILGIDAITSISVDDPIPGAGAGGGAAYGAGVPAGAGDAWDMAEMVAGMTAERPRITVRNGDDQVTGDLIATGPGTMALRPGQQGEIAYVRLDSTTEISVSVPS